MRDNYTEKWGVQMSGMNFQTCSRKDAYYEEDTASASQRSLPGLFQIRITVVICCTDYFLSYLRCMSYGIRLCRKMF